MLRVAWEGWEVSRSTMNLREAGHEMSPAKSRDVDAA
jgi:hypothetical protein